MNGWFDHCTKTAFALSTHVPMQPRCLFVRTYYPEFLDAFYSDNPSLSSLNYDEQLQALFDTGFGVGDAYSFELSRLGCAACEVICNADVLQTRWADEHGLRLEGNVHDRRRQIVAAQVQAFTPDVLFVFEWCPLGDSFLADMKAHVRLIAGQVASPLHADRTYAAYDLMLSSYAPLVDRLRRAGLRAKPFRLGFDERVLDRIGHEPEVFDVTFVGGYAPSHTDRRTWLEAILRELPVDVFGYGWEAVPKGSPIHDHYRGQAWGWAMYRTLARSRVTLNRHARIEAGDATQETFANNMRLYEATGVGTCLVTDRKSNLATVFEPGREVVDYDSPQECVERVKYLLAHGAERRALARAGQTRTLTEHTYRLRMIEWLDILGPLL